jgi:hypothetical protein
MNFWTKTYNHGLINDNQTMIRLNLIFDLFSFGNYHIHTVFINFLSLIGLTAIYKTFEKHFTKHNFILFTSVFLIPTVLFWASGVLKEGLLVFVLGLLFYFINDFFESKNKFSLILFITCLLLLTTLKVYVIIALIPGLFTYIVLRNYNFKSFIIPFITIHGLLISLSLFIPQLFLKYSFLSIISAKQHDFINISKTAGSYFEISKQDKSVITLITSAPEALINSLFRPFIWNATPIMYINSFENIIIFSLLIIGCVYIRKLNFKEKNTAGLLLSFTMYLYLIIGWTTPVAGALVRYKLPAIPFLLIAILLITNKDKIFKHSIFEKWNSLI